jgi:hypothetical protein
MRLKFLLRRNDSSLPWRNYCIAPPTKMWLQCTAEVTLLYITLSRWNHIHLHWNLIAVRLQCTMFISLHVYKVSSWTNKNNVLGKNVLMYSVRCTVRCVSRALVTNLCIPAPRCWWDLCSVQMSQVVDFFFVEVVYRLINFLQISKIEHQHCNEEEL